VLLGDADACANCPYHLGVQRFGQCCAAALVLAIALAAAAVVGAPAGSAASAQGWARYGVDASRPNSSAASTGITVASLAQLQRRQVALPGTADSSAVYAPGVKVGAATHDVFIVTTTYGITIAIDAASGQKLWTFTPPGYSGWAGSAQITTATPLIDTAAGVVYAASPDGRVHALRLSNGHETKGWPVTVTRDPTHEKIASALNLSRGLLLVTTGGYIGDAPPYQGHVVTIHAGTGHIAHVWNSLCSNRHSLLVPRTCAASDSAIWGRGGAVVEPSSGRLLVATGNAPWDGKQNWGDSVLELSPNASRLLQSFTPSNQDQLNSSDADVGSASPAVLPGGLVLQGGKDGTFRLLSLAHLNGHDQRLGRLGGELQDVRTPGGSVVLTAPAVWTAGGRNLVAVANDSGTALYRVRSRKLARVWENATGGTSPVEAGGLLYVYDPHGGGLNVYRASSPKPVGTLAAGAGHWNSPIVVDGRIALPEGNANDHSTQGILDIWSR
jgi:outer membrane protein assembly factor BamB